VPIGVENWKAKLGKQTDHLLKDLADGAASTSVCERVAVLHWIRKKISLSLIKGNASILKIFVDCLAQGVGEIFQQGANMPDLHLDA
jgi:hypothetical protein